MKCFHCSGWLNCQTTTFDQLTMVKLNSSYIITSQTRPMRSTKFNYILDSLVPHTVVDFNLYGFNIRQYSRRTAAESYAHQHISCFTIITQFKVPDIVSFGSYSIISFFEIEAHFWNRKLPQSPQRSPLLTVSKSMLICKYDIKA